MTVPGKQASFWVDQIRPTHYPPLNADLEADVAVIGAGIVGLTTALLLKRAGRKVAVIDAHRAGQQVTGRSTAKITSQHSLIYTSLVSKFGEDGARTYGAANQAAIERIAGFVEELGIGCDFERKAAYVFSRTGGQLDELEKEAETARRLGLPASFVREATLPFPIAGAVRFDDQAQFNPAKYTSCLADNIPGDGCSIFEMTRATEVEQGEPCTVKTNRGTVRARDVVIATNMPFLGEGHYYAKAFPRAHPVMAARLADGAAAPDGMFISVDEDPTHSVRTARMGDAAYLVFAGGSYKTGQEEELRQRVEDLERYIRGNFPIASIDYSWTNEDYDSMDRVPFVGRPSARCEHLYVATGFNAWGITNGTAAGMIIADLILGKSNPWAELYDAARIKPAAGGGRFIAENVGVAKHYVAGWLAGSSVQSPEDLLPGDSAVLKWKGDQVAAYRDEEGKLHVVSAVCTHLGCTLGWNGVDRTWDCPCHGSRFSYRGEMLHGPAVDNLKLYESDVARASVDGPIPEGRGTYSARQTPMRSKIDEASDESFPASDPPSHTPTRPGSDRR